MALITCAKINEKISKPIGKSIAKHERTADILSRIPTVELGRFCVAQWPWRRNEEPILYRELGMYR